MNLDLFRGTGVAVVTPFKEDGAVDYKNLAHILNHLISGGINYIVSLGTTGESATISIEERFNILDFTLEEVEGRVPVVGGFGGNDTQRVINLLKQYDGNLDAILSASPSYNKPNQEGIYQHFQAISESTDKPIIVYNVPSRTSSNINAETTIRLANDFENIIGIKEASGKLQQCMALVAQKPDDFLLISGDDLLALPLIALGFDGVISVVANGFPGEYSDMIQLSLQGDLKAARKIHYRLMPLIELIFADGNPAGIKAVLNMLGLSEGYLRLPLVPINKEVRQQLMKEVELLMEAKLLGGHEL